MLWQGGDQVVSLRNAALHTHPVLVLVTPKVIAQKAWLVVL